MRPNPRLGSSLSASSLSYSDSRVRYFNGQISSMQSAINNYREDS
jgi:hypothetical protein